MRITLNLSADALAAVRRLARERGEPLGAVASALILQALRTEDPPVRNGVPIFAAGPGAAAPDLELINRLRDAVP